MMGRLSRASEFIVEFWSAIAAVLWCKELYWFGNTLAGNRSYVVTASILDTSDWEMVALAVGIVQFGSLMIDCRWARIGGAGLAAWFWVLLGLSFFMSGSGAPGCVVYLGWGLANAHAMLRSLAGRR